MRAVALINHLQHLHSSISLASAETSWGWETGCPRTEEMKQKSFVSCFYKVKYANYQIGLRQVIHMVTQMLAVQR